METQREWFDMEVETRLEGCLAAIEGSAKMYKEKFSKLTVAIQKSKINPDDESLRKELALTEETFKNYHMNFSEALKSAKVRIENLFELAEKLQVEDNEKVYRPLLDLQCGIMSNQGLLDLLKEIAQKLRE